MSQGEIRYLDYHRINDGEAAVSMLMWNYQGEPSIWGLGHDIAGKEVGVRGYGYRESISWFMDPEEYHGHILGGSDAPSAKTTLTEIYIPLSCGERMILGTGELFPLENPTIKYLQEVPTLTVDGDQVVVDGDELLRLADEEDGAVQLWPVSGEGELALEAQHVQAPQSAAVQLFLRQLPLQVGAEEQERVVVHGFPQLARKMGQSGKVQGVGKGTGAGRSPCPAAKRIK